MHRILAVAFLAAVLTLACGGTSPPAPPSETTVPSPTSTASSPAATATRTASSPTPSATPEAQIQLPTDAPIKFGRPVAPDQVPLADIAPPDAQIADSWMVPQTSDAVPEIAFTWTRGSDPFAAEHGLEVWQRFQDKPVWRVVYAFTDAANSGILGVRLENGDLTGDGVEDLLTFEDTGGSGACGVWRVVESGVGFASEIYNHQTCDTQIEVGAGGLQISEAVYLPGDAHCCPSKTRHTTLEWDGSAWQVTSRAVTKN